MVFPTPVGVFPPARHRLRASHSLPHTRGGVSGHDVTHVPLVASSPHPWGCFSVAARRWSRSEVFPTPVGVFLPGHNPQPLVYRLPHTRGGVSSVQHRQNSVPRSSPHPWGCFQRRSEDPDPVAVFPTPVGVFPPCSAMPWASVGLPHTRGGVSDGYVHFCRGHESSPHPWGCFYFS